MQIGNIFRCEILYIPEHSHSPSVLQHGFSSLMDAGGGCSIEYVGETVACPEQHESNPLSPLAVGEDGPQGGGLLRVLHVPSLLQQDCSFSFPLSLLSVAFSLQQSPTTSWSPSSISQPKGPGVDGRSLSASSPSFSLGSGLQHDLWSSSGFLRQEDREYTEELSSRTHPVQHLFFSAADITVVEQTKIHSHWEQDQQ